ncbi:MAG: translation initiation factor IF-2 [bacterium]|nr:translation initiation factor IF-2 [bacterium]
MAKKNEGHRIRIYELAKEIGIDGKDLLKRMKRDFGIEKNTNFDTIETASAEIIKKKILSDIELERANKKTPEQKLREQKRKPLRKKPEPEKKDGAKSVKKEGKSVPGKTEEKQPATVRGKRPAPTRKKETGAKEEKQKPGTKPTVTGKSPAKKPGQKPVRFTEKKEAPYKKPRKQDSTSPIKDRPSHPAPKIEIVAKTTPKKTYKKKKKDELEELGTDNIIKVPQNITVKELADLLNVDSGDMIKKLKELGTFANITQKLDEDAIVLVSSEFGINVEVEKVFNEPEVSAPKTEKERGLPRAPIVTVMGHVDHGKTTLLDVLRNTSVAEKEIGKITQKIGASVLVTPNGQIVFLDTPGHEAFTTIRARGAQVTDIVVLVVAADDGVMPQTIEAINHAKAAGIPIIVAINKIDAPNANIDRVKQGLSEHGLLPDTWGGSTPCVEISALKKLHLDDLIMAIQVEAEGLNLRAVMDGPAKGVVIEAKKEKNFGNTATLIVTSGKLKIGDSFVCGLTTGKVKMMFSDKGERVNTATPSTPVELIGFTELSEPGDAFFVVDNEKIARKMVEERKEKLRMVASSGEGEKELTLEDLYMSAEGVETKILNLIVKCDSVGSQEAVISSLENLSTEKIRLNIIHKSIGNVTDNDVKLAKASQDTVILSFKVPVNSAVQDFADRSQIQIRKYEIIYELLDEIKLAMQGMLSPIEKEVVTGHAEVRDLFKISKLGTIAGCYVTDGVIKKSCTVRVLRKKEEIFTGKIDSLKHIKDDVREVKSDYECGIKLKGFNDFESGDIIEAFEMIKEKQEM